MTPLIRAEQLSRVFQVRQRGDDGKRHHSEVTAVDGVSFDIEPGSAVGYVGPNGSGKSTTIKMLTGILTPTSGKVTVCGLQPSRQRRRLARRIGLVFGQRSQLWWDLPLIESFELLRAIYRVKPRDYAQRLTECVEVLGLAPLLGTPVRQLSLGQRMRGEVTAALLHSPELLVLDEPTIGLDFESKQRLRDFLADFVGDSSRALLLTSHDLDDIEQLCSRMIVIDHGQVLADGLMDELRASAAPERTLLVELARRLPPLLPELAGVSSVTLEKGGQQQRIVFRPDQLAAAQLIAEVARAAPVRDISLLEPGLDDVVRALYEQRGDRELDPLG